MSGVVYGLLGYIWMMTQFQAATRYMLSQQTVMFMLVWLGLCLVGIIPHVANTEHVLGLVLTITAGGFWALIISTFCIGFANGSVEAVAER
jgi:membrane associated rhomboid family serine protease